MCSLFSLKKEVTPAQTGYLQVKTFDTVQKKTKKLIVCRHSAVAVWPAVVFQTRASHRYDYLRRRHRFLIQMLLSVRSVARCEASTVARLVSELESDANR